MSKSLLTKMAVIAALMLLLLVPLGLIEGLVQERQGQRQAVIHEIAQSSSGPQQLVGPVLVVPYRQKTVVQEEATIHTNGQANTVLRSRDVFSDKILTVVPRTLHVDGKVRTQALYRGLHQALTYAAELQLRGSFDIDAVALAGDPSVTLGEPYLAMGISDVRGIRSTPTIDWQGSPLAFQPDARLAALGDGMHVALPGLDLRQPSRRSFAVPLQLIGTTSLAMVPVAKETRVALSADWPHPSFFGQSLPTRREVRADGFSAEWQSTWFNTGGGAKTKDRAEGPELTNHAFGVRLIQPVDEYQQAERAMKYAILFVLLTFSGFFLFEMLRQLPIHPMQYALVGAALAMFYLLLIALSEHLAFAVAYAAASGACVALIGFYLSYVLRHWRRGAGFGAMLGLLYATLFALLQSEDNALVLGALLLFGVLAAVMILTRKLDWARIGASPAAAPAPARGPAA